MQKTLDEYLNSLAERTVDNTRQLRKQIDQRRNGMEDLYGIPFSAYGDANNPAKFYISLSPDYGYLEMFAFKLVIKPYVTTVTGGTSSAEVQVKNRNLSISNNSITPNPHNHETEPHTHNVIKGISFINTTSSKWAIKIHGVDITPYLKEQQNGNWINGEGIYPNGDLTELRDFYDVLDVACVKEAEGNTFDRNRLIAPEFKEVEISSDAPFGVDMYLYIKYNHTNR